LSGRAWSRERILLTIRESAEDGYVAARDMTVYSVARRMFGDWRKACSAAGVQAKDLRPASSGCLVPGCDGEPRSRHAQYCEKHYMRVYRRGTTAPPVTGRRYIAQHGYVVVYLPGHPLARTVNGLVYEHRAVAWRSLGPGAQECVWCREPVYWDGRGSYRLHVDHLDNDKENNHSTNLVPSCPACNSRGRIQVSLNTTQTHEDHQRSHKQRARGRGQKTSPEARKTATQADFCAHGCDANRDAGERV
jgi:hypothetical protein